MTILVMSGLLAILVDLALCARMIWWERSKVADTISVVVGSWAYLVLVILSINFWRT